MAGRKGTLTVRVVADTKAVEAGLDKFATKVSSTGAKVENAGKKMTIFASVPIAAAMGAATKAASDLQQAVGGTEAVFGEAGDAIDDYAAKAASASGLSEREFREATTSIGGQLKRMTGDVDLAAEQSIKLTGVAADLAATYGGTTAEAVAALGSAFRGEADPAERFNLNLKVSAVNAKAVEMGLAASTSEVDDNAKAQATLALIMEQSADAQGQFARESDSAAGSMQIAKAEMENASAEIGSALLPLVADLAGGVADLAKAFGSLPDPIQKGVLGLAGLLAVTGPVLAVGGKIATAWPKVASGIETAGIAALYAKDNLAKLALQAGVVAGATIAVTKAIDAYGREMSEASQDADAMASQIIGDFDQQNSSVRQYGAEINRLIGAYGELSRHGDEAVNPLLKERFYDTRDAIGEVITAMQGNWEEAGRLRTEMDLTEREALDLARAEGEVGAAADGAKGPTKELAGEVEEARSTFERAEDAIKGYSDALTAQFDPLFAARDALRKNQEAQWKVMEATDAVSEAQRHYNDVEAEFGKKSPEAQYAYHQLEDANRNLADAKYDTAEAALDAQTATSELARKMASGEVDINKAKESLRQWVDQGLITEDQANQTAGELDNVARQASSLHGRNITIPVDADTSGFLNKVTGLYQNRYGEISIRAPGGHQIRHSGGPVQPGRMYLTGGKGREELFASHKAGRVLSHAKTLDALGGSGTGGGTGGGVIVQNGGSLITLAGGEHDADSIARHVAWVLGRY